MSDILSGLTIPEKGKRVYKEDWDKNFQSKDSEIINRDIDLLGYGIHSGGSVSLESGLIRLSKTIVYNQHGQRIEVPEILLTPPDGQSFLCIRHKFNILFSEPDYSLSSNEYRENSYEVIFRTILLEGDVALHKINKSGSSITIEADLRSWRTVKSKNIEDGAITDSKLSSSTKIGDINTLASKILSRFSEGEVKNLTKALNYLLQIVDEQDTNLQNAITFEAQARSQADTNLQNAITFEAQARSQADTNLQNGINGKAASDHNHDDKYAPINHTHVFEAGKSSELWSWAEGLPGNIYYPPQNHHITGGIVYAMDVTGYYIANNSDHIFSKGYVNGLLEGGNLYVRFFPDRVEAECTVRGGYWCRCLIFISHN